MLQSDGEVVCDAADVLVNPAGGVGGSVLGVEETP